MTPAQYQRVKRIFQEATELDPQQVESFVSQASPDDPLIRQEVLELLAQHNPAQAAAEGSRSGLEKLSKKLPSPTDPAPNARAGGNGNIRSLLPRSKPKPERPEESNLPFICYFLIPGLALLLLGVGIWMTQTLEEQISKANTSELKALADASAALALHWGEESKKHVVAALEDQDVQDAIKDLTNRDISDEVRREKSSRLQTAFQDLLVTHGHYELYRESGELLMSSRGTASGASRIPHDLMPQVSRVLSDSQIRMFVTSRSAEFAEQQSPVSVVILAPILNQRQGVQAFLLVYDHHFLQKFRDVLSSLQLGDTGDVYAFSTGGWNLSQPRHVASLVEHGWISPDEEASSWFRLVDPGVDLSRSVPVRSRAALPLTESVAAASAGLNGHNDLGYRNYAGVQVLGAWRWIPSLQMGVVVERAHREIFASLASIRQAYYFLLGALIFAGGLAWFWARRRLRVGFDSPNTVGPYELVVPLASGGMGTVYRARHSLLKRPAAVKVIRADRLSEDDVLRFDREVRIASKLSSPHTISIFDYGQSDGGQWYFAMELLDGMTLDKVVQRYGPLPAHRVVHIARQICESLYEAHQLGMIHRDIKPQNIMLTQRGLSPDFAVVFDFGLAKPIQPEASLFMTSERMWVGTPMYMSPERIRDPKATDSRSDVYAVGVLMYFLLVGDEPFSAADPSALFEQIMTVVPPPPSREAKFSVPQSLDDLIADCMAKSLEQRPAHVAQLRSSLDAIANEIPWNREEAANWWNSAMSH